MKTVPTICRSASGVTNPPKIAAKYRVYTGLQRVTLPNFEVVNASPSMKTKGLWAQICHFLSLDPTQKAKTSDAWISFQ